MVAREEERQPDPPRPARRPRPGAGRHLARAGDREPVDRRDQPPGRGAARRAARGDTPPASTTSAGSWPTCGRRPSTATAWSAPSSAHADHLTSRSGGDLQVSGPTGRALPALPAAVEVAAYRIVTEAMTNAARHAGAHALRISLHARPVARRAAARGRGRRHRRRRRSAPGTGLASMRERAEELGGSCVVVFRRRGGHRASWPSLPCAGAGAVVIRVLVADDHPVFRRGPGRACSRRPTTSTWSARRPTASRRSRSCAPTGPTSC